MALIPFGPWLPDLPVLGNPGVLRAVNVFPTANGYKPVPAYSTATDALDARPRGAIQARNDTGEIFQYAGDAGKLYQNVSGEWTDVSKGGGYSTGSEEIWEFVAWKNKILGTNFTDDPQQITFGASNFSDLTTDFQARHLAVVRDFVVAANTNDSTDGAVPSRVRNSAFNDETDWTVDPATLANFKDLKNAAIERIFGGEYGVILQRESVWRMSFAGAPTAFDIDETIPGIGTIAPGAAARRGDTVYTLSDLGFFAIEQGARATPIGAEQVDETVLGDIDKSYLHRVSAVADPKSRRVFWSYPGSGNAGGRPNKIVVYDPSPSVRRWSVIEIENEMLWRAGGTSTTVDSMSGVLVDALDIAVDSSRWVGGAPEVGIFNESYQSGFLDGPPQTAIIETGERELVDGAHAHLNAFRALVDGGSVQARIGTRDSQTGSVTYVDAGAPRSENRFTRRSQARYHRVEATLSGAWKTATGIQVDRPDLKRGGRRG